MLFRRRTQNKMTIPLELMENTIYRVQLETVAISNEEETRSRSWLDFTTSENTWSKEVFQPQPGNLS